MIFSNKVIYAFTLETLKYTQSTKSAHSPRNTFNWDGNKMYELMRLIMNDNKLCARGVCI